MGKKLEKLLRKMLSGVPSASDILKAKKRLSKLPKGTLSAEKAVSLMLHLKSAEDYLAQGVAAYRFHVRYVLVNL